MAEPAPGSSADSSDEGAASTPNASDDNSSSSAPDASTPAAEASEAAPAGRSSANSDEEERIRKHLLAPIGRLYALAQSLTRTEHAARQLVERTYERAAEEWEAHPPPAPDDDPRPWLFTLLIDTARTQSSEPPPPDEAGAKGQGERDRHFRRRVQERFLRRALPPAFAALAPKQRLLLTLCDIEQLRAAEAANIMNRPEKEIRREHAEARTDLRDRLRQMAARPEHDFLVEEALPDERLHGALRQMAERNLTAPPPALRPAARHALHRKQKRAEKQQQPGTASEASTASDRSAQPSEKESQTGWLDRLPRALVALLLIATAGGVGYLATTVLERPAETNLAALSAQHASDVELRLRTDRPARAEQFVRDELNRRLTVPHIEGAVLRGVGVAELVPDERIPVFLFRDSASGRPVTAYAYDYALLDRTGTRLQLPADLREQLTEEGRFATQEVNDHRVHLWRHRDDIFAAVTDRADSLQQRIAL